MSDDQPSRQATPKASLPRTDVFHQDAPDLTADESPPATPLPSSTAIPELPYSLGRYTLTEEIARGGMGVVFRAEDTLFHRTLAIKVLLQLPEQHNPLKDRFLEEAQLMGQLQHPGIPPVHDRGELPDGRPYLCMKLIKGNTLAGLLQQRQQPTDDLPRLIEVFEQICQTVACAHSRDVLHRDLKPHNVMVGSFGEVQVMDWGLAKVKRVSSDNARITSTATSTIYTVRTDGVSDRHTAVGTVLGTPAYMAPEQARGEVELLDERCDVFGLGAILSEILTGRPPFATGSTVENHRLAMQGDVTHALERLDACGADPELITLAKQCLAPNREHRPVDAGAVAQQIRNYQDQVQQRLRQAEIDRARAQTKVLEERKRHRVSLLLALVATLFVVSLAFGWAWYARTEAKQQVIRERLHSQITSTTNEGTAALKDLQAALGDPVRVRELMNDLPRWRLHLKECEAEANEAMSLVRGNDPLVDSSAKKRVQLLDEQVKEARRLYELAVRLDQVRQSVRSVDDFINAETLDQGQNASPDAMVHIILEGIPHIRVTSRNYLGVFREDLHLDVENGNPEKLAAQIRQLAIRFVLVAHLDHWTSMLWKEQHRKLRRQLISIAQRTDVPDPWRDRFREVCYNEQGRTGLQQLVKTLNPTEQPPHVVAALAHLLRVHNLDVAKFAQSMAPYHPDDFWLQASLGAATLDKTPDLAISFLRAALAQRKTNDYAHAKLGRAYASRKLWGLALTHYRLASEAAPHNPVLLCKMAAVHLAQGHLDRALRSYQRALQVDPSFPPVHFTVGEIYRRQKEWDLASKHYQLAVKHYPNYALAHNNLAIVYRRQGKPTEAITHCKAALQIDPNYASAHNTLGNAYLDVKQPDLAMNHFKKALKLGTKSSSIVHNNLGNACKAKGELARAIQHYELAIKDNPGFAAAHYNLAMVHHRNANLDKAIHHYQLAINNNFNRPGAHYYLGNVYFTKNDIDKAIQSYRAALKLDRAHRDAHYQLGYLHSKRNELDLAIQHYRRVTEIDPRDADAYCGLGHCLRRQGKLTEALKQLKKGHALGTQLGSKWTYPSGKWVQECEQWIRLDRKLHSIAQGKEKLNDIQETLDLAFLCLQPFKQQYHRAAQFYRQALQARHALAQDVNQPHVYDASCVAVLAAAGRGNDAKDLTDAQRVALRKQALDWLRTELAFFARTAEMGASSHKLIVRRLQHRLKDPDLSTVREEKALKTLPTMERKQWQALWRETKALLQNLLK